MNVSESRPNKQRNVKQKTQNPQNRLCCRWISHLHLPLHQMGPELLGCTEDLPLVSQQVHPEILDVTKEESR